MPHIALPRASLIPLDNLLGAWLLGVIFSALLFGVTCLQIFLYFTKYGTRDSVFLRIFVIFLFALDTLHLALVSHSIYHTVVTNFGDYVALRKAPWSLLVEVMIGNVISTMVQLFYAARIYTISKKSLLLPILIVRAYIFKLDARHPRSISQAICSLTSFVLGALYTHKSFQLEFFQAASGLVVYLTSGLSFIAAGDLLISCTMIYLLFNSKTGFKRTNKAINTLVAYTVSSGAITTVFTIGDVVAGSVWPSTLIQIPFFFIFVRLHCLSFMSILNSRDHIRQQLFAPGHAIVAIPSYQANSSFPPEGELAIATELKSDRGPSSTLPPMVQ
ncbi:hypothetical protein R3P38DRAFT_3374307 [Favolaschia claudopus]|uniref:DUF6534 domain-containing protein n=1 Tax=Favolaschia claudopus TaxID=2862362 RepID=A0AAV9ZNZ9_9AGAR